MAQGHGQPVIETEASGVKPVRITIPVFEASLQPGLWSQPLAGSLADERPGLYPLTAAPRQIQRQIKGYCLSDQAAPVKKLFRKVLLGDEEQTTRFLCRMVPEEMQVAEVVTRYEQGEKALRHLVGSPTDRNAARADGPDPGLAHLNRPLMDGPEVLEAPDWLNAGHIIQGRVGVPTSPGYAQDAERAGKQGGKGYIIKPLTKEKVRTLPASSDQPPVVWRGREGRLILRELLFGIASNTGKI